MTGQGETVQLFNRVGAPGFRGLEGWDRPPFSLDLCEKSLLTSPLPVEPLGRGRGPIGLGSRCSHLCLLPGCMCSEFSVSCPLCLASSGHFSPVPVRVLLSRHSGCFPLTHSFVRLSFGWRTAVHQVTHQRCLQTECMSSPGSHRACCGDGGALSAVLFGRQWPNVAIST